jgi:hypothetical protein
MELNNVQHIEHVDGRESFLTFTKESLLLMCYSYCKLSNADAHLFAKMTQEDYNDFTVGTEEASGIFVDDKIIWARFTILYKPFVMWLVGKTGTSTRIYMFHDLFVCIAKKQMEENFSEESESANFFSKSIDDFFELH